MGMEELQIKLDESIKSFDNKVTDFINKSTEELETNLKLGRENKEEMKVLNENAAELKDQILEIQQQISEMPGDRPESLSIGQEFVNSASYKEYAEGKIHKASFEIQNAAIVSTPATTPEDRRTEIVGGAFRRLRVSEVIPGGNTQSNAVEYTRENVFTNAAAETDENTTKPESTVTFELINTPVRTIAHFIPLSKQVVDDAPMIASYVDGRMRYGVLLRYDNQLLNGDGTGVNLSGMRTTGNLTAFTPSGTDPIVSVREAITQVELADYMPTGVVMNPTDVQNIDLVKTTDGEYVAADPRIANAERLWGLPIVSTNQIPAGQFVVGAFDMATQAFERQGVVVEMFEQDSDNVQKNMITMRAEMRAALAIYRPASVVGGALST